MQQAQQCLLRPQQQHQHHNSNTKHNYPSGSCAACNTKHLLHTTHLKVGCVYSTTQALRLGLQDQNKTNGRATLLQQAHLILQLLVQYCTHACEAIYRRLA